MQSQMSDRNDPGPYLGGGGFRPNRGRSSDPTADSRNRRSQSSNYISGSGSSHDFCSSDEDT